MKTDTQRVEARDDSNASSADSRRRQADRDKRKPIEPSTDAVAEIGGVSGPEPTRYGDWEKGGRCIDF